jgi:hypothetical protein
MLLKMAGLGICDYLRDNFNRFDTFVVCVSLVDQSIELINQGQFD